MTRLWLVLFAAVAFAQNPVMTGSRVQINANGGRVAWSANNVIAFDTVCSTCSPANYYHVYTMTPSGGSIKCITCPTSSGASVLSGLNDGTPVWSPDGNYLIFQSQAAPSLGTVTLNFPGFPGEGANNDLWATDTMGNFWQLTNQARWGTSGILTAGVVTPGTDTGLPNSGTWTTTGGGGSGASGTFTASGGNLQTVTVTNGGTLYTSNPTFVPNSGSLGTSTVAFVGSGGVIYAAFSWDGTKLAWGQRLTPGTPPADPGVWELAVATFSESGGMPSISGQTNYQPFETGGTAGYYEPHSFSLDNTTVFFMGDKLTPGMNTYARNIYSYNLSTTAFYNLTRNFTNWNEYPLALPAVYGSNKIIYMQYPNAGSGNTNCLSDYWIMNYDGTDSQQLTFFTTPGNANYQPTAGQFPCMDDHAWSPSGTQLVAFANYFAANGHVGPPGPIWILNLLNLSTVYQTSTWLGSGVTVQ